MKCPKCHTEMYVVIDKVDRYICPKRDCDQRVIKGRRKTKDKRLGLYAWLGLVW